MKHFNNIKNVRKNIPNLTQEKLANLLNITTRHLQRLEAGSCDLSLEVVKKLAIALNCTPADIIGYENLGIASPNKPIATKNNTTLTVTFFSNGRKLKKIPFTKESLKALNLPTDTQLFCKKIDNTWFFLDKQDNVITTFALPLTFKHKKSSPLVKIPASITQRED